MIWNIFKKNKLKSEEGKLRLGFEYFKEFLDSSLTDIKSTSNAANITIPYLELMDKIKEDMKDIGKVELHPKFDGKQMIMVIQPL